MLQWAFEPADEAIITAMIDKGACTANLACYSLRARLSLPTVVCVCWGLQGRRQTKPGVLPFSPQVLLSARAALHTCQPLAVWAPPLPLPVLLPFPPFAPAQALPTRAPLAAIIPQPVLLPHPSLCPCAGKQDAVAWMESMELTGEKERAEAREAADVGQVAAAKEAAVGTSDAGAQAAAAEAGQQRLEERAQRGAAGEAATGAGPAAPAQAAPAADLKEQQAQGAAGPQKEAVEAAARLKDQGASDREAEAEAEQVLREAEEREGQGGNLWAKALGAASVAATGAAIAAAVTSGGLI